ncbi:MAG: hypothetical protein ABIS38_03990 [Sphingomicrobium sp.]
MKAGQRLSMVFGVAALALAALPARAQDAAPAPAETPETNAIGPRELQNYSIDGTVTRRVETPAERSPAPARTTSAPPRSTAPPRATAAPTPRDAPPPAQTPDRSVAAASEPAPAPLTAAPLTRTVTEPRTAPAASVTVPLPPIDGRMTDSGPTTADFPVTEAAPNRPFSAWPWLLAAIALALGGLFLWRSRARHAFAGYTDSPQVDAFVAPAPRAPEPCPPHPRPSPPRALAPRPDPTPPVRPAAAPASLGIVSTRLRPRLDITFTPLRCSVDGDQVVVEFELELINSGSAPARGVLIEASLFNAGQGQDQAIGAFFANPVGEGERIAAIAPLKRFPIHSRVVAPRANVQLFNIEGREVFVPLIAFNALYAWSGGDAQSSSAYLVGRDTGNAKLAPFRADLGARQFTGLGARPLPATVSS